MAVIRTHNGWISPAQLALMIEWGVRRCNVQGCKNKPNTIVTGMMEDHTILGFCEKHYQEGNVPGGAKFTLVFDNFDAFAGEKVA